MPDETSSCIRDEVQYTVDDLGSFPTLELLSGATPGLIPEIDVLSTPLGNFSEKYAPSTTPGSFSESESITSSTSSDDGSQDCEHRDSDHFDFKDPVDLYRDLLGLVAEYEAESHGRMGCIGVAANLINTTGASDEALTIVSLGSDTVKDGEYSSDIDYLADDENLMVL